MSHGVKLWSSESWRELALSWLDERLAAAGIERTGEVEQPHLRPWATVLRAPTTAGPVWLKATGPGAAFEPELYELLARIAPERVLTPIAVDAARGWVLLPDGGPSLGERLEGAALIEAFVPALAEYGRLQRELAPHVDEMLAMGVADMRPAAMPERFEEALAATAESAPRAIHRRVEAMRPAIHASCERLAASPAPASLDHNDLHPWNVLGGNRYYDWGDSVIAHPFAVALVPLGMVRHRLRASPQDAEFLRARDSYLEAFADLAPHAELVETLELACQVAKIARVLTWDRSFRAALEQGEKVDEDWTTAPAETLASLLDRSYLGGA